MHACTQNFFSRRIRGIILSSTGEGSEAYFRKFYYGYFISFNIPGVSRPPPPVHSCMAPFIHLSLYIAFQYIHVSSVCTIHDHSYICVRVWVGMILLKKKIPVYLPICLLHRRICYYLKDTHIDLCIVCIYCLLNC